MSLFKLKNGAEMLALIPQATGQRVYVAAQTDPKAAQPFATWELCRETGETFHGHYFTTRGEALRDCAARAIQ